MDQRRRLGPWQLAASVPWPTGSIIHVVGVASDDDTDWFGSSNTELGRAVIYAVEQLRAAGLNGRRLVVAGQPASSLTWPRTSARNW